MADLSNFQVQNALLDSRGVLRDIRRGALVYAPLRYVSDVVTFKRQGNSMARNADGTYRVVATNEPAWGYDDVSGEAVLHIQTMDRMNYFLNNKNGQPWSANPNQLQEVSSETSPVPGTTVIHFTPVKPDFEMIDAKGASADAGGDNRIFYDMFTANKDNLTLPTPTEKSSPVAISVFVKPVTATKSAIMMTRSATDGLAGQVVANVLKPGWQRITAYGASTPSANSAQTSQIRFVLKFDGEVLLACPQIEVGGRAGLPIVTDGTHDLTLRTRYGDSLFIDTPHAQAIYAGATGFTIAARFRGNADMPVAIVGNTNNMSLRYNSGTPGLYNMGTPSTLNGAVVPAAHIADMMGIVGSASDTQATILASESASETTVAITEPKHTSVQFNIGALTPPRTGAETAPVWASILNLAWLTIVPKQLSQVDRAKLVGLTTL